MTQDLSIRDARILVVDDEMGIRDLLRMELTALGYTVETAKDGVEALETMSLQDFQLVLSDIKMPHVGGLQVLEVVREKHPDIEVIMMTGYGTVETAVAAMKQGAYDFIQKPFDLNELVTLIEKCLEKSRLKATTVLYEASQSIFRSIKIDELLPLITNLALKIFEADAISIMLIDDEGTLVSVASSGILNAELGRVHNQLSEQVKTPDGFQNEPKLIRKMDGNELIKSALACPFAIDNEPLGVLVLSRTQHADPFLMADRRNAAIFASQIAQAVFNAKLYRCLNANIQELQTANKRIEETQAQLIQSEKLAGIGQLAAGVAHELNNPLSGVLGFSEFLIADCGNMTAQQKNDLNTIYTQGKRCQVIIQNLLQFSRRSGTEKQAIDVIPLLNALVDLTRHEFAASSIKMNLQLPSSLPPIYGNSGQLQQVFLNLLTNARHAVTKKEKAWITVEANHSQDHIFIRISDNGCGMSKEIKGRIFEPFFTTKPVGQGTGLGLSICYGIIQQHQGKLSVESEVDNGSIFTVELPLCAEKNDVAKTKGAVYGNA